MVQLIKGQMFLQVCDGMWTLVSGMKVRRTHPSKDMMQILMNCPIWASFAGYWAGFMAQFHKFVLDRITVCAPNKTLSPSVWIRKTSRKQQVVKGGWGTLQCTALWKMSHVMLSVLQSWRLHGGLPPCCWLHWSSFFTGRPPLLGHMTPPPPTSQPSTGSRESWLKPPKTKQKKA